MKLTDEQRARLVELAQTEPAVGAALALIDDLENGPPPWRPRNDVGVVERILRDNAERKRP